MLCRFQDALGESFAGWSWTASEVSGRGTGNGGDYSSSDVWWHSGGEAAMSPYGATSRFDSLWAMDADPLGATNLSRFELQHLFPSQVLLQA